VTDAATLAGRLLALPLAAVARARQGKPMHPRGAVLAGRLVRTGCRPPVGVPWLDEPGTDDAVVRLSRGAGLPEELPDLLGLAVRVPGPDGRPVDLLMSSTGTGLLTRWLPQPRWEAAGGYCSLMGYRAGAGTVVLGALPERTGVPSDPPPATAQAVRGSLAFTLVAAPPWEPWRPFGRLELGAPSDPLDPAVRFDAVLNPPPGLVADGPVARLREPSYAGARQASTGSPV
jgi:hypothetical protein